jgi:hypothetical protein
MTVSTQPGVSAAAIERVLVAGDLGKLTEFQKVQYYKAVCESLGLNILTQPFAFLNLQGKTILYATKSCTEQIRHKNGISITKIESKMVDDVYVVTASAKDASGRTDEATGAVTIGNLKGDQKANAIMKAETKAKRRVTLSIAGLGFTDESEVETIPGAQTVEVDFEKLNIISEEQAQELFVLNKTTSPEVKSNIKKMMEEANISSWREVPVETYKYLKDLMLKHQTQNLTEGLENG